MRRSNRSRKVIPSNALPDKLACRAICCTAGWTARFRVPEMPSAKTGWAKIASYLGWMALPKSEGGLGFPSDQLQTLAWLAVPDHIEAYLKWLRERCGGKYTGSTFVFLGALAWMVRPGDGY